MTRSDVIQTGNKAGPRLAASGLVLVVALPLGAGFLARLHPFFDSFAHFRVHLAVLLIACALVLLVMRRVLAGVAGLALAGLALVTTSHALPFPPFGADHGILHEVTDQPVYTLMHLNLRYDTVERTRALSLIGRVQPDVVTLNEVSKPWAETLALIDAAYPYSLFCPFPNRVWGVAILSRRPFTTGTQPSCDRRGAFGVASVDFGGRAVEIASLHLGWPWPFEQAWQINGLAGNLGALGDTALLAGDLNATPWSATAARVSQLTGLSLMPSPGATWLPARLPAALRFMGLPIDQVFAGDPVLVHSVVRLDSVGSDHWPLLVAFSLNPGTGKPSEPGETATALAMAHGLLHP
jgi:endonuclease/exonuclease/phosphatase (EEP) superfamily protein YafD